MPDPQPYFRYWGKTAGDSWHPLPCHCLDVAAVAAALLEVDGPLVKRLAGLSPLGEGDTVSLLCFFAALHDLGKFSPVFQALAPDVASRLGHAAQALSGVRHTSLGHAFWRTHHDNVARELGLPSREALEPLAQAAFGHHGTPVHFDRRNLRYFQGAGDDALTFVSEVASLFPVRDLLENLDEASFRGLSWLAAGVFVLADWIGSNQEWFPPSPDCASLAEYWPKTLEFARAAVRLAGVLPAAPSRATGFHDLLPTLPAAVEPHPMQRHAMCLAPAAGPCLLILEDLTGSGKTEAAVLAAHGMMRSGQAAGLFVALPTMATANAMYSRLAESYRALFANPEASLVLAHGGRALHEDYLRSIGLESTPAASRADEAGEGGAVCAAWLADNGKKSLLAPCGVGTLDQALLAVLPVRHQCLRLLGLSRSVLVADEVHAYDTYTGGLLEHLLTLHAALGGSAILLSATLPRATRHKLVCAFLTGRALALGYGFEAKAAAREAAHLGPQEFPLATLVSDQTVVETPVAASRSLNVAVRPLHDDASMLDALVAARAVGACACWVRNTVADVMEARRRLVNERGLAEDDVLIFHARYVGCDRQAIEQRVLDLFGKHSTPERRRGKILIASQVVEQSLDLDFDLLLSDLAPMELMIQRAGRCHRHERPRPAGYESPVMLALMPEPLDAPEADWYARMFPVGQYVYPRPALLWRTARLLAAKGRLLLPEDARELVEGAYAEEGPEVLLEAEKDAVAEALAGAALAASNTLDFASGYGAAGFGADWHADDIYPTRLGMDTRRVRLLRVVGDVVSPWAAERADDVSVRACMRSEVSVSAYKLREAVIPEAVAAEVEALRESMRDKGKWSVLLPLVETEPGVWSGEGHDGGGRRVSVRYGKEGLLVERG